MSIRIKLKGYDIIVLPLEGKVLGRLQKDGTRKEIFTGKNKDGYHHGNNRYPEDKRSRLIWVAVNGQIPEGMQINHRNHIRHDDRIENLELVTSQQNNMYRHMSKKNTIGYKGVSVRWCSSDKKWRASIGVNKKTKYLGYFSSAEEAASAYDEAARKYHGRHAVLNFPDEVSNG